MERSRRPLHVIVGHDWSSICRQSDVELDEVDSPSIAQLKAASVFSSVWSSPAPPRCADTSARGQAVLPRCSRFQSVRRWSRTLPALCFLRNFATAVDVWPSYTPLIVTL